MRAGALREQLQFQRSVQIGVTPLNAPDIAWVDWNEPIWCEAMPRRGREVYDSDTQQRYSEDVWRFRVRYVEIIGAMTTMRIVFDGQNYDIRAISIDIRSPRSTRPWQPVLEPLCGYLLLAERLFRDGRAVAEAWNFGPAMTDVRPVGEVVEHVTRLWGDGAAWQVVGAQGGHEAGLLAVDAAKAQARLHWRPRLSLADMLDWTVTWYKNHRAGGDAATLVLDDIARYELLGSGCS